MMSSLLMSTLSAYGTQLCFEAEVDYDDSDVYGATEDYHRLNTPKKLRGVLAMHRVAGSGGAFINTFADHDGSDPGCIDIATAPGIVYEVRVQTQARVAGHDIDVVQSFTGDPWEETVTSGAPLHLQPSWTFTVNPASPNRGWNVLVASAFSLHRRTGGLPPFSLTYHLTNGQGQLHRPTGCTGNSCLVVQPPSHVDLYLDDPLARRKFAIAYGTGRALLMVAGMRDNDLDDSAEDAYCGDVSSAVALNSVEHDSAAALSGLAYLYAATVWNQTTEDDCSFTVWTDANWDLQSGACYGSDPIESPAGHVISCVDGPTMAPKKNQRDYCQQVFVGNDPEAGTSVPIDWMRFLWERQHEGDESFGDMLTTFANAFNAPTWPTTGAVYGVLQSAGWFGPRAYEAKAEAHGVKQP